MVKKQLPSVVHIPLISIPRIYQISPNNIPKKEGYLTVNARRQKDFFENFINTNKIKVKVLVYCINIL